MGANIGILIIRLGLGIMFMFHGFPKLKGGPETWTQVGGAMAHLGVHFAPAFWGFAAACTEFFGGICLIMGLLFKPTTAMLTFVMLVAALSTYARTHSIGEISHPFELFCVFLGLWFIGPGKYKFSAVG